MTKLYVRALTPPDPVVTEVQNDQTVWQRSIISLGPAVLKNEALLMSTHNISFGGEIRKILMSQLAFYVNLHRAVIGPSATLTGRRRPDIDLRRMLTRVLAEKQLIWSYSIVP